jgi:hypothetical protein
MKAHDFYRSTAFAFVAVLAGTLAQAAPTVVPPHANAYGMGYDGLAISWTEWVMSIPVPTNPLLDEDGGFAAIGQSGPVWYLAGTFGGAATRTIAVPSGKALFLPIANYFWVNTPEFGDAAWSPEQEAFARSVIAELVDTGQNLVLQIDGRLVPNVYEFLRAASETGMCMLPDDNLYGAEAGPHECVADGFWALLPPMSTGQHTIYFHGEFGGAPGFVVDVTYHISVGPGR